MEAVLKNLTSSAELLAVAAHSCEVEQWDKQTLTRAFHWARYCEILFSRFHNNTAIRKILEKHLQLTNQSLAAAFTGYTEVTFTDLSRCQHMLLSGLLNNPELPISIIKMLFDAVGPVNTKQSECQDVSSFCSRVIESKAACKVLSPLTGVSAVGADAQVQGVMLMERVEALLSQGSEAACRTEHFLDSVLQGREGEEEHFCRVIAAALLTTEDSAAQTASQEFLLDWLQRKNRLLQHMCSALPITHIINLAKQHQTFKDAYFDVLKKWASDMEFSLTEGEWVQTSADQTAMSYCKLTEHLKALCSACASLREGVEKELNAMNMSHGDFEVRGLSVWGDLLSALNS